MENLTPEQRTESARRLLVLADFLETVPPERFNFRFILNGGLSVSADPKVECHSTACAIGWMPNVPEFAALGVHVDEKGAIVIDGPYNYALDRSFGTAAKVLSLSVLEVDYLFSPQGLHAYEAPDEWDPRPISRASAKEVAVHIRSFVAKHRAPIDPHPADCEGCTVCLPLGRDELAVA